MFVSHLMLGNNICSKKICLSLKDADACTVPRTHDVRLTFKVQQISPNIKLEAEMFYKHYYSMIRERVR